MTIPTIQQKDLDGCEDVQQMIAVIQEKYNCTSEEAVEAYEEFRVNMQYVQDSIDLNWGD